jgi:hypothetical protein
MNIRQAVRDMIKDNEGATVDDLHRLLPQYTREQIKRALAQNSFYGRLRCERQHALGRGKGSEPGRYYTVQYTRPFVIPNVANSVWALGARA